MRVKLSDDDKVLVNATASHGNVVIHNVPSRTVVIEGSTESNLAGAAGGLGNSGSIAIKMLGFGTASTVENNDFSQGTNGWTFGTSPATVVPHAETVGPTDQLVPPSAAKVQMKQLASIVTNNDLELSTSGEGAQSMSRTFTTKPGTTSVVVRYRFVTSEVPGGFFGSEYNDYFSVIIRSSTSAASEAKTMNSLGLTAFDAGGSTGWRTLSINTNPQGDQIQVDATVANVGDGAYQSQVLIDFVEETRDKVKPTLTWNSNAGGISLGYSVQESALESPVTIDVYWARGNNYGSRIGNPIFSFTVPAGTAVGTGGPIPVKGNLLADDPSGATHLIATSSETMIAVLGDVQVSYGPNANAAVVNAGLLDVIKDSLRAAGQPKATITSTARSAADQARAMFNNLINTDHSIAANTATQLELYKAPGRAVVNVFTEKTKGMTLAQILEAKSMIRDAMEAEIVSQGPSSVSSHCADPAKRSTVDVGMNAFNLTNGPLFVSAATPRVSKLLNEPKNKAYHLELEVK